MYEIHGWVVVSTSTIEEDDEEKAKVLVDLRHRVAMFSYGNPDVRLLSLNGEDRVTVSALLNHDGPAVLDVLSFYEWIGDAAPGSYGIMFARDDENPLRENQFVVYVMKRGKVTIQSDPFLSPCVPLIED